MNSRRLARELALKVLYRHAINPADSAQAMSILDDPDLARADVAYFKQLVTHIFANLSALDDTLSAYLDRPLINISPVELAILRIAASELSLDNTVPYRVIINESIELAKRYGGTDGYKYVNGVLDKLALAARGDEVKVRNT